MVHWIEEESLGHQTNYHQSGCNPFGLVWNKRTGKIVATNSQVEIPNVTYVLLNLYDSYFSYRSQKLFLYCYVRLVNTLITLPITFKFIANILADYNPNKILRRRKKKPKKKNHERKKLFILHIKHQK